MQEGLAKVDELADLRGRLEWHLIGPLQSNKTKPVAERMAQARRWARGSGMIVSDAETRLGSQYTIDTLRVLKARFPGVKFVWVMGADSLAGFHRWRGWTQIMREVPVAVISRPWIALKARTAPAARRFAFARWPASAAARLPDATAPAWVYLTGPLNFASSTALRARQTDKLGR